MGARLEDLPFTKWQGCGNDYLFVDLRGSAAERIDQVVERAPAIARAWSDRRFGIGSDGLVLLLSEPEADLRLLMWNADGSRGAVCGTALRCATAMLADERGGSAIHLRLASDVGFHATRVERDLFGQPRAAIELGTPRFAAVEIPFRPDQAPVTSGGDDRPYFVRVPVGEIEADGAVLSMGNPHLVVRVEQDPSSLDLARLGPPLESAACFPDRANVSFVELRSPTELAQRTFERGTGETLSCGSGACAAVVALTSTGLLERGPEIAVRMPGGTLGVRWAPEGELWLSGPTAEVFTGRAALPD